MTDTPNPDTQSSAIARASSEHPTISLPPDQLAATERALITARRHMPSSAVEDNAALAAIQEQVARQLNEFEQNMVDRWNDLSEGRLSRDQLSAIAAAAAAGVGAAGRKDSSPPSSIRSRVKRWQAIAATIVGLLTTVIGADATMGDSRLVRAIVAGVSAAAAVMTEAP